MTADYRILLDVPLKNNLALGFEELATAFQSVIETSPAQFAIGLFGSWGSGKTTLMEAIAGRLNRANCAVVSFSAWRYEKEQHLIVPLLDVVREGLLAWQDENAGASAQLKQTAKQVAATVGKAIASLLAGFSLKAGVPGGPEISYEMNKVITRADKFDEADMAARVPRSFYHASFRALQEAFAEFVGSSGERRIVVFVDDLDRCLPDGTLEVLEAIKLFFDIPGFVFIVGLDQRVVEMSIEHRYHDVNSTKESSTLSGEVVSGASYIRKIFQVPYALAPVSTAQIDDFLNSVSATALLPPAQWDEISTKVRPHLRFLADASGMNPREVKRFINAYTLVRKIKPYLNEDIVLALQTIAFRSDWRSTQFALLAFSEAFIDALKLQAQEPDVGHLEGLAPGLASLPQSFSTYVENGQPGHALVATPFHVTEYLFSGEATRSTTDTRLLDLFRDVGGLITLAQQSFRTGDLAASQRGWKAFARKSMIHPVPRSEPRGSPRSWPSLSISCGGPRWLTWSTWPSAARGRESPSRPGQPPAISEARETSSAIGEQVAVHIRQAVTQLQELYQAGVM
jgi:KAP family P-loop domain